MPAKKHPKLKPGAKDDKQERPRKIPKPIEPFTEDDFEASLRKGGLNGSTQHSAQTHIQGKQKLKALARVRSAGTLPG
jgi:hypothetical protein